MNFDDAIKAHLEWKTKLARYLQHPDRSIKAADTSVDNNCVLGKWIYGEGGKYSSLSEFSRLKNEHERFHKAAAEIIKKADAGVDESEEVALGSNSDFSLASSAVVLSIMAMKAKAGS